MSYNKDNLINVSYDFKYFTQNNVCRLCWTPNAVTEICITDGFEGFKSFGLLEKIQCCLDIVITSDGFSNKLCEECFRSVERFYEFKLFCKESDRRLQDFLCTGIQDSCSIDSETKLEIDEDVNSNDVYNNDNDEPQIQDNSTNSQTNLKKDEYINASNVFGSGNEEPGVEDNCFIDSKIKLETDEDINQNDVFNTDNDKPLIYLQNIKRKYTKTLHPEYYCKKCQFNYDDGEEFSKHNKYIHGILPEGLYQCLGCERHFNFERSRRSHELKYCKTLNKGYFCSNCDRYLPKRKMYELHKLKHLMNIPIELPENMFQCIKCKSQFKTRELLGKHFDEQHRKKKHFVCEQCGRVFRRMDYLNKHMLIHNGLKKHVCSHCGHRTAQKSSLNIHIRKHTGDRPFQCDQCPMKCLTSSNLIAHKLTHAGVKKYECDLCSKKFGYKLSLEEHITASHGRIKSFVCNICHTSYSRSGGLRRHMRSKHSKVKTKNDEPFLNNIKFRNKNNFIIGGINDRF